VKRDESSVEFRLEYTKRGGQPKARYQAYLLAYLDKNASHVPAEAAHDLIDKESMLVLHTGPIERNENGTYEFHFKIDADELAKKVIAHAGLTEKDRESSGGWGSYKGKVRIAVVVPFLEDEKYSVLSGLPEDKHECNYANDQALLFQELPGALSIHFGIVDGTELPPETHKIKVNGDKRSKFVAKAGDR
jgi:hypothetical protein